MFIYVYMSFTHVCISSNSTRHTTKLITTRCTRTHTHRYTLLHPPCTRDISFKTFFVLSAHEYATDEAGKYAQHNMKCIVTYSACRNAEEC